MTIQPNDRTLTRPIKLSFDSLDPSSPNVLTFDPQNEWTSEMSDEEYIEWAFEINSNWNLLFHWLLSLKDASNSAQGTIHAEYAHGGGWMEVAGFAFDYTKETLEYPGDPSLNPLWKLTRTVKPRYHDQEENYVQHIYGYQHDFVAVVNPETFVLSVARID